jgi:DNA-binding XRE family transcriptional regulator
MKYALDVRALRKKLSLTQAQLAEKVGVNHATIWRWENEGVPTRGSARAYLVKLAQEAASPELLGLSQERN